MRTITNRHFLARIDGLARALAQADGAGRDPRREPRRGRGALVVLILLAAAGAAAWFATRKEPSIAPTSTSEPQARGSRARFEAERDRGYAAQVAGRDAEAVEAYERALAIVDDLDTRANLANALKAVGRVDEAAREYARVLEARPRDANTWYNLGNLQHRARHEPAAAVAAYRRATEIDPLLGEAHFALGAVLLEQGDTEAAIASLQAALQVAPTAPWRADADNALTLARIRDAERRGQLPPPR